MCARKILVVDDEPIILDMLDDAFSKVGYSVFLATNADVLATNADVRIPVKSAT
jgi:CheY-like chemotaxis protein